jgi:hypothetical protein
MHFLWARRVRAMLVAVTVAVGDVVIASVGAGVATGRATNAGHTSAGVLCGFAADSL